VVADILDARTADELDAAILEARHRSRLLHTVEDGVLTLDARTVEIIEAERAATLDTLEHDHRRRPTRRRPGLPLLRDDDGRERAPDPPADRPVARRDRRLRPAPQPSPVT
jgi:hypothetical protein